MIKNKKVLCVIPARAGSKGLPGKNIKKLLGEPLIAYTIEQAKKSRYIDRIVVSTDSSQIAAISRKYGAEIPFMRPAALATSKSGTIDVLLHAMNWMEQKEKFHFDILLLLHVTAPLRIVKDIDNCIELLIKGNYDNLFSVTESHKNPYFNMVEVKGNAVKLIKKGNFSTRQSAPQVFDINCSIYVWWKDILRKKKSLFSEKVGIYIMPKERSVDIDDYTDFKTVEMLLKENISNVEMC